MLIDNKFVFVKIPKNASTSVQNSLFFNDIKVEQKDDEIDAINISNREKIRSGQFYDVSNYHQHISVLYGLFPKEKYPYIGIKRDSTERFISAFKHVLLKAERGTHHPKVDFSKFEENDIIEYFKPVMQKISTTIGINDNHFEIVKEYFCDDENEIENSSWMMLVKNFQSQYFWGINECDFIFDFNNLGEFENFLSVNLKKNFKLLHQNSTQELQTGIKKTDKLDEFVYNYIDSPFLEKKLL